jgi:cytidylate kinase
MTSYPIITIDGNSGSGKGTLAYRLAQTFNFQLLDSGALYRIVGLRAYQNGILTDAHLASTPITDATEAQITTLANSLVIDFVVNNDTRTVDIVLNGFPLTDDIRNEFVGKLASKVATLPTLRTALLDLQRNTANRSGVVADGRDMGTVVFPHADVKVFLTADSQTRAKRRFIQLQEAGKPANFDDILADIKARDAQDEQRAVAPSMPAPDALILDSSTLSADEVYDTIYHHCTEKLPNKSL